GGVEVMRFWESSTGNERMQRDEYQVKSQPELIAGIPRNGKIVAITETRYMWLEGNRVDQLLGWSGLCTADAIAEGCERMSLVQHINSFRQLPLSVVREAFSRMRPRAVKAKEQIIQQGQEPEAFYLIESGAAEVWRTDPITEQKDCVAHLTVGGVFGEEAIIQGGKTHSDIIMVEDGELLVLERKDFESLIGPAMLREVDTEEAHQLIEDKKVELLDCRHEIEFEDERIPGCQLIPLDRMRRMSSKLDRAKEYLVYCRSGKRSLAAAYLLSERGFNVRSIKGGIINWPYTIDEQLVDPKSFYV
ncbi:MAG: cyclic nucleotide-binding domain-containing protein, partial [bacterium]